MKTLTDAHLQAERDRILKRSGPHSVRSALCGRFDCHGDAPDVHRRVKELMLMANRQAMARSWPGRRDWADLLSPWFKVACVSSAEWLELDYRMPKPETLPEAERTAARFATRWTVDGWLLRMDAARRDWLWGTAEVSSNDLVHVAIEPVGDPVAEMPGELLWLFHAAGAAGYQEQG